MSTLRIATCLLGSRANGPGERMVVWVQGCSLACPGCQNPQTWQAEGGNLIEVSALLSRFGSRPGLRGLTLSGGEPFEQPEAASELAEGVRGAGGDVLTFSGYTLAELSKRGRAARRLLEATDLLVDGRWDARQRVEGRALLASANQRHYNLTGRILPDDLQDVPPAEWIGGEGGGTVTGIAAGRFAEMLRQGMSR